MKNYTDRLRVAALPLDIVNGDKEANLKAVEEALQTLPQGTDIVVLPELFSTGYVDSPEALASMAERNTQQTVALIHAWADAAGCAFAGSFLASTAPNIYNRAFFIEPNGDETFCDKRHLFSLSSESRNLRRGDDAMRTVRFRGWNVAMAVCYDIRFPVWCRNVGCEYDILLVPANWPQVRAYAWEHLLIARAIENQSAVVGANRGGEDRFGLYDGLTFAFDCLGRPVAKASADSPWVTADFSKIKQDELRRTFPVSADADSFTIR